MALKVSVIGEQKVVGLLLKADNNINSAGPAFRLFAQRFRGHIIQHFATEGASSGTPWQPLDPQYAAWKTRKYGPKKMLQREGTLRESLMRRAMSVMTITQNEMVLGTEVPYAVAHQEGRGVPKRPIIVVTNELRSEALRLLANHIAPGP